MREPYEEMPPELLYRDGQAPPPEKETEHRYEEPIHLLDAFDKMEAGDYPDQQWLLEGLIPTGYTVLAADPKVGKTWLAMIMSMSTAVHDPPKSPMVGLGMYNPEMSGALYMDLEDQQQHTVRRLHSVVDYAKKQMPDPFPAEYFVVNDWERIGEGGLRRLDQWLTDHDAVKFVVIDTLARVWPNQTGKQGIGRNAYHAEYDILQRIKKLAYRHKAAIVGIHHSNKGTEDSNPIHRISGTTAHSGVADAVLVLHRERTTEFNEPTNAILHATGKAVRDRKIRLGWVEGLGWVVKEDLYGQTIKKEWGL